MTATIARARRSPRPALAASARAAARGGGEPTATGAATRPAGSGFTPPDLEALDKLGTPEGAAQHRRLGRATPRTAPPTRRSTGSRRSRRRPAARSTSRPRGTSDEMVNLMKTGQYDAVSASGDASLRLIAVRRRRAGQHRPGAQLRRRLRRPEVKPWNSRQRRRLRHPARPRRQPADVPHRRGQAGADSWAAVFDDASPYKGKVTAYDSPIYIADAALYLMKTKPDLGIKNPYALDDKQFTAAVDLLKAAERQHRRVLVGLPQGGRRPSRPATRWSAPPGRSSPTSPRPTRRRSRRCCPRRAPPAGRTPGWSPPKAKHKTCAYKWMDRIICPEGQRPGRRVLRRGAVQQQVRAPRPPTRSYCDTFHADDEAYFDKVWYWTTPITQCLDGRTDVKCKDYGDWTRPGPEIKG